MSHEVKQQQQHCQRRQVQVQWEALALHGVQQQHCQRVLWVDAPTLERQGNTAVHVMTESSAQMRVFSSTITVMCFGRAKLDHTTLFRCKRRVSLVVCLCSGWHRSDRARLARPLRSPGRCCVLQPASARHQSRRTNSHPAPCPGQSVQKNTPHAGMQR